MKPIPILSACLLLLALAIAPGPRAHAFTETVTTLIDGGTGSLRAAVESGATEIVFDANLTGIISLTEPIVISQSITFITPTQPIILDGDQTFSLFEITNGTVTFNGLTFREGGGTGGGAIRTAPSCNLNCALIIRNSTFQSNRAESGGALALLGRAELSVRNSTFAYNGDLNITSAGGAIYLEESAASIENVTFLWNDAATGGTIFRERPIDLTIVNSILQVLNATPVNCDFGGSTANLDLAHNIEYPTSDCGAVSDTTYRLNPLIELEPTPNGGPTWTLKPRTFSPVIDAGFPYAWCAAGQTDQTGGARTVDGTGDRVPLCDLGAVEYGSATLLSARFKPLGSGDADVSQGSIAPNQSATLEIYIANPDLNQDYTYNFIVSLPSGIRFVSDAVEVRNSCGGGFPFVNLVTNVVRHSGFVRSGFPFCTLRFTVTATTIGRYRLDGPLVVTSAAPAGAVSATLDVGMYECSDAGYLLASQNGGPAIFNCTTDTVITPDGRGVLLPAMARLDGFGRIRFQPGRGTSAFRAGAGGPLFLNGVAIFNSGESAPNQTIVVQTGARMRINNSEFRNYYAGLDSNGLGGSGAVLYIRTGGMAFVTNSTFADNTAWRDGGAIYVESGGTLYLANSSLAHNAAGRFGGAIYAAPGAQVFLYNVTIAANNAVTGGGGVYAATGANVTVSNSIIAYNTQLMNNNNCAGTVIATPGSSPYASGSLEFPGDTCGAAVGNADPQLAQTPSGSLRYVPVMGSSIARDNGSPTYAIGLASTSPARGNAIAAACSLGDIIGEFNSGYPVNDMDQRGYTRGPSCDIGATEFDGINTRARLDLTLNVPPTAEVGNTITATVQLFSDGNGDAIRQSNEWLAFGYTGTVELGTLVGGTFTPLPGLPPVTFRRGVTRASAAIPFTIETPGTTQIVARDTLAFTGTNAQTATRSLTLKEPPRVYNAFAFALIPNNTTSRLTYRIENPNPHLTLTGIQFVETLPAALSFNGTSWLQIGCGGTPNVVTSNPQHFQVTGITLGAGASCHVHVVVTGTLGRHVLDYPMAVGANETTTRPGRLNSPVLEVIAAAPPPIVSCADRLTALSGLRLAFASASGSPDFNASLDYDGDARITVRDFSWLATLMRACQP